MKMKPIKKLISIMTFLLFVGVFAHTANLVQAKADDIKVSIECFQATKLKSNSVYVAFKMPSTSYCCDIALYDVNKNLMSQVKSKYTQGTEALSAVIKDNMVYYYRIKPVQIYSLSNGTTVRQDAGSWSPYRAICTLKLKTKLLKRSKLSEKVTLPKVKGVKNAKIMISRKEKKGYKKVKVLKPGKSCIVTKCGSKNLKKNTTYYFQTFITLKDGTPCDAAYYKEVRIRSY